jgi:hypothetical protein
LAFHDSIKGSSFSCRPTLVERQVRSRATPIAGRSSRYFGSA